MLVIKPGVAARSSDNSWVTKMMGNHRMRSTAVHPMDIDETNAVASIANITRVLSCERTAQML